MFIDYIYGKITMDELCDWVCEQINIAVRRECAKLGIN